MFSLTLVTPLKKIVEKASVKEVLIPAYKGEIEILPGHAPLITTLSAGVLCYKPNNGTQDVRVAISWGYCEVTAAGEINVLAETAEAQSELNLERAEKAREQALANMAKADYDSFEKYRRKFERSEARIKTIKGH